MLNQSVLMHRVTVPDSETQSSFCWASSQGFRDLPGLKLCQSVWQPLPIFYLSHIVRMGILYLCLHFTVDKDTEQYGSQYQSPRYSVFTSFHLYVKPLAITLHIQQSQPFKALCNNREGRAKQDDRVCQHEELCFKVLWQRKKKSRNVMMILQHTITGIPQCGTETAN